MANLSPFEVKLWDEVLDPNGDVTLVFDDGRSMVRVYSKVLSLASPSFAEILDSIDELMRSKRKNSTIVLDTCSYGTNPQPMILILTIVHHKSRDLPSKITIQELSEIVVICRKYIYQTVFTIGYPPGLGLYRMKTKRILLVIFDCLRPLSSNTNNPCVKALGPSSSRPKFQIRAP